MVEHSRMDDISIPHRPWLLCQITPRMILFMMGLMVFFFVSAQTPAKTIPEFTFYKQDKSPFTQKDVKAGTLSFFVFFDITCEHCQSAIKQINKQIGELKNTTLYLVTLDIPSSAAAFLDKYGKNLIDKSNVVQLYDVKNQFIIRFSPKKYPSLFLFSPQKSLMLYDDNPEHLKQFFEKIKSYKP